LFATRRRTTTCKGFPFDVIRPEGFECSVPYSHSLENHQGSSRMHKRSTIEGTLATFEKKGSYPIRWRPASVWTARCQALRYRIYIVSGPPSLNCTLRQPALAIQTSAAFRENKQVFSNFTVCPKTLFQSRRSRKTSCCRQKPGAKYGRIQLNLIVGSGNGKELSCAYLLKM